MQCCSQFNEFNNSSVLYGFSGNLSIITVIMCCCSVLVVLIVVVFDFFNVLGDSDMADSLMCVLRYASANRVTISALL